MKLPLEPELEKAVLQVVSDKGQPATVAKRLIAWLEEMSKSDISKEDHSSFFSQVTDALEIEEVVENED
jgi:hypothetical protein